MPVDKNGYLYIYVSNETPNIDVFFDNLQVTQIRGPILEETHYYPGGLVMNGISTKAFGSTDNNKKYNSYEQNKDFDLNTYESFYRVHDPQLGGRFWQIDPSPNLDENPYSAMGNNPIRNFDLLGDTITPIKIEQLQQLFPQGNKNLMTFIMKFLNAHAEEYGISDNDYLSHYLAQAGHETGGFKNALTEEGSTYRKLSAVSHAFGKKSSIYKTVEANQEAYLGVKNAVLNLAYANKLNNGDEASGEGSKYKGRGFFQLTGKVNYAAFNEFYNKEIGSENFINHPESVATNPQVAVISSLWYFKNRTVPAISNGASFERITKTINAKGLGMQDRRTYYDDATRIFNEN